MKFRGLSCPSLAGRVSETSVYVLLCPTSGQPTIHASTTYITAAWELRDSYELPSLWLQANEPALPPTATTSVGGSLPHTDLGCKTRVQS
jgi:hypothetical protein